MLAKGLNFSDGTAICFSSEKSASTTLAENGIADAQSFVGMEQPNVYSAELTEFIFKAGVKLLQEFQPDLMYLTTTDYIQHSYAPNEEGALAFYEMIDRYLAQLDSLGARILVTADHGMSAKTDANNNPDIVYLNSIIDAEIPAAEYRTILPITDPYVAHHGALGSFAGIYAAEAYKDEMIRVLSARKGILGVKSRSEAVRDFELAGDRIADLIVLADPSVVLGKTPEDHDLSQLHGALRSHGGVSEWEIPMVANFSFDGLSGVPENLKNRDAFWLALNAPF